MPLIYSSVTRHVSLPFAEYRSLQGYSHSFLKYQKNGVMPYKDVTPKMRLGSVVDAILTDSTADMSDPIFPDARKIAIRLKDIYGSLIKNFVPQVSYTALLSYMGLVMPVQGRLDWELPALAVIDLKVTTAKTDKQFQANLHHMGYKNQLFHYNGMASVYYNAPMKGYILPYSTTAREPLSLVPVPHGVENEWWEEQVKIFGK